MASLSELIPYLERGFTLKSSRGESLRLVSPGKVQWIRAKGYYFEDETVTLAEVKNYKCVWSWEVVSTQGEHDNA